MKGVIKMQKISYEILYKTFNFYEPNDSIILTEYFEDSWTTSDILIDLREKINRDFGDNAKLGRWEVVEE